MARKVLQTRKRQGSLVRDRVLLEERREEICAVALTLFLRDGFHGTTTRAIAQQAGISTGALFTYFEDKEQILVHIITHQQERAERQMVEALQRQFKETANGNADPVAVFSAVFDTFMRAVHELRHFILLAYQETKSLNKSAREALKERERRVQQILLQAIQYGVERGRFAPGSLELKAHNVMVLGHAWALRRWVFVPAMDSVDQYIRFLRPLLLAMLEHNEQSREVKAGSLRRGRRHQTSIRDFSGSPASMLHEDLKETLDDSRRTTRARCY